ncbi:hypothetical protein H0H81_004104 [Sphagnurus paluster]|uniref:Uncharacterized protein n=1 Tax=Sphagnurus paluster TaxID=117069 RepID=A0A9P7K294_9AGAR|nr:hypothetical protein H0H81_004104 [Sphagnurus paluster]
MGNRKRKAQSPAELTRPAPSRLVSPVLQVENRCDTPDQGYFDFDYAQQFAGEDSSDELDPHQQEPTSSPTISDVLRDMLEGLNIALDSCKSNGKSPSYAILPAFIQTILNFWIATKPNLLEPQLKAISSICKIIDKSVNEALAKATPPPPPPPTMEVDSPTTPTGPKPSGATPPTQGNPTPPAALAPRAKPAPVQNPLATCAPKHTPPPPPSQPAPKLTYAVALGSKAPRPRKAHPPTKLDAAKRPSPHHIVSAINRELLEWASSIGRVHVANLGESHILAATWTVGCNILITATKTNDYALDSFPYSNIVGNTFSTIPSFSNAGVAIIPYRPAARLQIKGLPTWDPINNAPVKLTSVFQLLDGLGIFEGVKLIKNGPASSDALSWARDPKTFNAESRPCAVTVRFYNHDGQETGALLKKVFYLLGRRRRFDKWQPKTPPLKKG